jgi:HAE1 family hydrophobic/amphiphilic exporter-1
VLLPDISIKRPVFATMIIAALVLFGIISRQRIGVALYPDVDFPIVSITTTLSGASPEVSETELTDPIEESISSIEGLKRITSSSLQGASQVIIEFELDREINVAVQDVRDKVALANRYLPKDITPPTIGKVDISAQPIIWIAVNGNMPRKHLAQIADEVFKPQFETLVGVGSIMIGGLQEREMRIWLDAKKMEAYHVTAADVEQAILNKNVELPGGRIESSTRELTVKTIGELKNTAEFNNLIISYSGNSPVRLKDIGFAEDGVEDVRSLGRFMGVNSIGLGVTPRSGANHVAVCNRVKDTMKKIQSTAPKGINLDVAFDSSEFIKNSISDVQFDLLFGGILAALVVFLFLRNIACTIIVALAIPTSIIGTFSIMYSFGFNMNTMTMLALSLCVGLVIDDAIVVLENIFRHKELGEDKVQASHKGTNEIAFAATAATLSIVAVFIPVAFIEGLIGRFYFQFGVIVSAAVLISLFVSLTLTPMLCSKFLRTEKKHGRLYDSLEKSFSAVEKSYRKWLEYCLDRRGKVLFSAFIIFILSLLFFKILDLELVQKEDRDDFIVMLECPVGTSLEYADKKLAEAEKIILDLPETISLFALMGAGGATASANKGWLFITLSGAKERERTQDEIMVLLRKELNNLPGIVAYVESLSALGGGMGGRNAPLQFNIKGPDLTKISNISKDVIDELRKIEGIVDVGSDMELTKPEILVSVNRDKAADLGIDIRSIASTINTLIGGKEAGQFKHDGKSYDVRIRLIPEQRVSLEDINRLLVRNKKGDLIRLSNIVDVREDVGPNIINRSNRLRSVTISANLESGKTLGDAVKDVKKILKTSVPSMYTAEFSGQAETMAETRNSFIFAFFLTILITYMVLASQFESFIHPFTVMVALPLSAVGALGGLYLTGNSINIMSLIGMLMLVGLVVKNSILLVDYANKLRDQGLPTKEAVLQAGPIRLRPILMTAISTIAGVLPVAIGLGTGGEVRAPMAIAVIGGLTTSTILTLFVVPVTYILFDDIINKLKPKTYKNNDI